MADEPIPEPITVTAVGETVQVAYDDVRVDFRPGATPPEGTPLLARRIFEAYRHDLHPPKRAE